MRIMASIENCNNGDEHRLPRLLSLSKHKKDGFIDDPFLFDDEIGVFSHLNAFDDDCGKIKHTSPFTTPSLSSFDDKKDSNLLFVHNDDSNIFDNCSDKIEISDFFLPESKLEPDMIHTVQIQHHTRNDKTVGNKRALPRSNKTASAAKKSSIPKLKKQKTNEIAKSQCTKTKDDVKRTDTQKRRCVKSTSCYKGVTHHCRTGRWESHICKF